MNGKTQSKTEGYRSMPQCDADQCTRESAGCVVLIRGDDTCEFRLCRPHTIMASWYGHYGGLNTGDGMGCWRPREEVYYYQIGDGTRDRTRPAISGLPHFPQR